MPREMDGLPLDLRCATPKIDPDGSEIDEIGMPLGSSWTDYELRNLYADSESHEQVDGRRASLLSSREVLGSSKKDNRYLALLEEPQRLVGAVQVVRLPGTLEGFDLLNRRHRRGRARRGRRRGACRGHGATPLAPAQPSARIEVTTPAISLGPPPEPRALLVPVLHPDVEVIV